jgi:ABC-type multidrug transport system ATPase subunit
MIYCREAVKCYEDVLAIDRVSLEVHSGICALVGPNGAGKPTLLKLLQACCHSMLERSEISGLNIAEQPVVSRAGEA